MNLLFLSIIYSMFVTTTSIYSMELPQKNSAKKLPVIWSFPVATALSTIILGTQQAPIENFISKIKDDQDDSDWHHIKERDTIQSRTPSPITNVVELLSRSTNITPIKDFASCNNLTSTMHIENATESIEAFILQNPNFIGILSDSPQTLPSYEHSDNNFAVTHDDIKKSNIACKLHRLHPSNESFDSTTPSEKSEAEKNHSNLALWQENHKKTSQPGSSPIERFSSSSSSPKTPQNNRSLLSFFTRKFTSTIEQIDLILNDFSITFDDCHNEDTPDSITN